MEYIYIKYDSTDTLLEGVKKKDYYEVIGEYWDAFVAEGPSWHSYSKDGKSITVAYRRDVVYELGLPIMYNHALSSFQGGNYKRARILITDLLKFVSPENKDIFAKLDGMLKEAELKLAGNGTDRNILK